MKFWRFVLLFVLLSIVVAAQQYARYLMLTKELNILNEESKRFALLIDKAMYEEATIQQQLRKAERSYNKLRSMLPTELQEEKIEQQLYKLATKYHIKILATKTAINSRPLYREATLNITLEANDTQTKRFINALKSSPRIINIATPEHLGKKNVHLSITIYALNPKTPEDFDLPHCVDMPAGIVLPPLQERLSSLYADYSQHCLFVTNFGEIYLKQRRLRELQEENSQLQKLIDELEHSK